MLNLFTVYILQKFIMFSLMKSVSDIRIKIHWRLWIAIHNDSVIHILPFNWLCCSFYSCLKFLYFSLDKPFRRLSHSSNWRKLNTIRNKLRSLCDNYPSSSSDLRPEPPRIATYFSSGHRCNGFLSIVIFLLLNLFLMP